MFGGDRNATRPRGHTRTNARPTTLLSGMVPFTRESDDSLRWSPMTHSSPAGTFTGANSRPDPAGLFS